ncbi:hypothetical protein [Phenylobacterium sp.]|uniref:hypothetical protein n=1 Tax=Phenylobacterium sp. TaxID=1871053 RepID=UPI0012106AAD|nr:hypothetical protein [Phenylobacterium sp.]THD57699.1 MAG: hypothetical protein E8A12_13150 [Phenylobacterium sp.]
MTAETPPIALGWRVYGLGAVALAVAAFLLKDFLPGQAVPKGFPERTALAYAAAGFLLVAGAAVEWRRTAAWAAGALTVYFGVVVCGLMDVPVTVRHRAEYGAYSNLAEQLAIAAGGLIVFARSARIEPALAARLTRLGQAGFGVCAILFGGAHFAYMNLTAPLVPKWLPLGGVFWGDATGVFHILGGVAILIRFKDRLAAILLTVMYAAFTPLVHLPMLIGDPANHWFWSENATNLALTGVAWVVADSLAPVRGGVSSGRSAQPAS